MAGCFWQDLLCAQNCINRQYEFYLKSSAVKCKADLSPITEERSECLCPFGRQAVGLGF